MTRCYLVATLLLSASALFAEGPEFEVASIKPFVIPSSGIIKAGFIGPSSGGPGTNDPTHLSRPATSLKNLLMAAFDMKQYQVIGPATLDQDRFDFSVVLPEGATKDDLSVMWRNLLTSRFGMKYHIEQREFQVDELTIGPRGHKLKENNDTPPPAIQPSDGPSKVTIDREGKPILPRPGLINMLRSTPTGVTATMVAKAQPIGGLITMLSNQLGHPVVDKTGLNGKYDFSVEYAGAGIPGDLLVVARTANAAAPPSSAGGNAPVSAAEPALDLVGALQQQLGLRLVKGKDKLDVVVVDKIERTPTEN